MTPSPVSSRGFFPFCLTPAPEGAGDFVEASLTDASRLYWNLKELAFESTGDFDNTTGDGYIYSSAFNVSLGPVESLPPDFVIFSKYGSFYSADETPACPSAQRVCEETRSAIGINSGGPSTNPGFGDAREVTLAFDFFKSEIEGNVRIYYSIRIAHYHVAERSGGVGIFSPSTFPAPAGTPPTSGNLSILGINFPWAGGSFRFSAWVSASGVGITTTSSAYNE